MLDAAALGRKFDSYHFFQTAVPWCADTGKEPASGEARGLLFGVQSVFRDVKRRLPLHFRAKAAES